MSRPQPQSRQSRAARRPAGRRSGSRQSDSSSAASHKAQRPPRCKEPASESQPIGNGSILRLRISQLVLELLTRHALRTTLSLPSWKTFPDKALMEAILHGSRDRSSTAYHLLELVSHLTKI